LSANNILLVDGESASLVDSGYSSHRQQTLALVRKALGTRPLDLLLNTHLHSDHCGGNAALQSEYPLLRTFIPPGHSTQVAQWDAYALTYVPTGQVCERFSFSGILKPGTSIILAAREWQIHAAPGHDPHSIVLFEPISRCLLSADALWEHGFGVVFPELEGEEAFDEAAATLDLIEALRPKIVVPGHGRLFTEVSKALATARERLAYFARSPAKHAMHAAKVLIKFKLLEMQDIENAALLSWTENTPYFRAVHARYFAAQPLTDWFNELIHGLVRSHAAVIQGTRILNG
jgi:glyoxylase-like metal-dependent hydrolase (beta-lactamase superfamily II)